MENGIKHFVKWNKYEHLLLTDIKYFSYTSHVRDWSSNSTSMYENFMETNDNKVNYIPFATVKDEQLIRYEFKKNYH